MSELYLVRHAQASFGASNYDQLSPLGFQQSRWLGEYFRDRDVRFNRVITGTLARQRQTAEAILELNSRPTEIEQVKGFNEFDFHALSTVYCHTTNTPAPLPADGIRPFFQLLRLAIKAWSEDLLHNSEAQSGPSLPETWQQFHDRVADALLAVRQGPPDERILVVSSGGAIAMALSQVLHCNVDTLINLNMQIKNTGVSQLVCRQDTLLLSSFNNAPHLERSDRSHALTYA